LISTSLARIRFANRLALHHRIPVPVIPADVRESQKIECFGFSLFSLYPVQFGKSPELNPARLIWGQLWLARESAV
jgi:hypothetical protein